MRTPRDLTPLGLLALVAIVIATMAALGGSGREPPREPQRSARSGAERRSAQAVRGDPAVEAARRYALAARNWTPDTYLRSWQRQVELAGGAYRRALVANRPAEGQLAALRTDRARSTALVRGIERREDLREDRARVLVVLDETTVGGGQRFQGPTVNEARLRRRGGRWYVIGWTVIPGG